MEYIQNAETKSNVHCSASEQTCVDDDQQEEFQTFPDLHGRYRFINRSNKFFCRTEYNELQLAEYHGTEDFNFDIIYPDSCE